VFTLLNQLRNDPTIYENIAAWKTIPARTAKFKPIPETIHPALSFGLSQSGISALYSHQIKSWEKINHKENIAIVTGTSSGKSLCYNLPVVDNLLHHSDTRALYLFPTKALSQDQLSGLNSLLSNVWEYPGIGKFKGLSIRAATYDGDTSTRAREAIRNSSRIILTNPDMLHAGILPQHTRWVEFFRGLRYVIIDEIHIYRGVFGSHVANVIRRLKRIATFYGAEFQYILTSATIGNPQEHAQHLINVPITLITKDGSALGEKHFLIYNPPIIDPDLGLRASIVMESMRLAEELFNHNIQSVIFGRSRRIVEVMLNLFRNGALEPSNTLFSNMDESIKAYRSGYLPEDRREIEAGLRNGKIRSVIATTALELGIDIGQLEAAILVGYPGTIAGTWQQAGRAGRGQRSSIAILVVSAKPLDQFLARHPDYIFEKKPEQARICPNNLLILLDHLQCASFELPIDDGEYFIGNITTTAKMLAYLKNNGTVYHSNKKFHWSGGHSPANNVSLRNASSDRYTLKVIGEKRAFPLGEIDGDSVFWMTHPDAIYLHNGKFYLVNNLDIENLTVYLTQTEVDYYTKPKTITEVDLLDLISEKPISGGLIAYGEIKVTEQVTGYHKLRWGTHEVMEYSELVLPPSNLITQGYIIKLDEGTVNVLRDMGKWVNDTNKYGPNWISIRDLTRKRDGFICQVCGMPEETHRHHVHHKRPFRTFSSYIAANELDNLITLCPSCHSRVENGVRVRSGLSGLSHILGNLAPFYLMCDSGDIGIFSDPKSHLNDGGPAIVTFDRVPGGMGFSQRLFEIHTEIINHAYELTSDCVCKDGCPSCVGPGGELGSGSKNETLAILDILKRKLTKASP
jgi:DEAD/DEAH box helicase domain-containing protein